jgi:Cys-rich repeat protein
MIRKHSQKRATFRSGLGRPRRPPSARLSPYLLRVVLVILAAGCGTNAATRQDAAGAPADGAHPPVYDGGEATSDVGEEGPGDVGDGSSRESGVGADCQAILSQTGLDIGFVMCGDGTRRRRAAVQCPFPPTTPGATCLSDTCTSDSQCSGSSPSYPQGYCLAAHNIAVYCGCFSGCRQDSDCGAGSICECGVFLGRCVPANCRTNADCGNGFACIGTREGVSGNTCNQTSDPFSSNIARYVCETAADGCRSDQDCKNTGFTTDADLLENGVCLFNGTALACGLLCAAPP